jgi:hypothetical protein
MYLQRRYTIWWYILCMLCIHLSSHVIALHIEDQYVKVSPSVTAVQLASFRFGGLGQLKYHLKEVNIDKKSMNETMDESKVLQNTTLVLASSSNWYQFRQKIIDQSSDQNRVKDNETIEAKFCQSWHSYLDGILIEMPFKNITSEEMHGKMERTVRGHGTYLLLVLLCSKAKLSWTNDIDMINYQSNGEPTHLDYGLYPIPWIYLALAVGIWPFVCLCWGIRWWKYRKTDTRLHRLLASIAILSLGLSAVLCMERFNESKYGIRGLGWFIVEIILRLFIQTLFYASTILISKGWCITRSGLLTLEKRIVWGTAFFTAAADVFFEIVGSGAVIAVATLRAVLFMYLWLNFRHQQSMMASHLYRLHAEHSPSEIAYAYIRKSFMLFYAQRVIITFGIVIIAVNFFSTYLLSNSSAAYLAYITPDVTHLLMIVWLGWLFRLRPAIPIDLSKPNGPVDQQDRWETFNTLLATLPGARTPVIPTAPTVSEGPQVIEGIGVVGVRERILRRLRRSRRQTDEHPLTND